MSDREADRARIAEYALRVSDRSVDEQYDEVQSVRLRASFLLTVNALSATLFVQLSASASARDALVLGLAVVSFCACNILCVLLMMPSGRWRITKSGGQIVDEFVDVEKPLTVSEAFSILAFKTDEDQARNEEVVRRAHYLFFFAVVSFVASTIFWVVLVAQTIELATGKS